MLITLTCTAFPQSRDEEINKGIDHIYNLKFDSARVIFQKFIDRNPKDPTGYFFQAMSEWWKIYLNKDDRSNDDNYLDRVKKCIEICDENIDINEDDDWSVFLKGGVIGYRGFLNSLRDNWLKAIDDGREGLGLIQRSYELNPSNKDAVFGVGLYNYAADYVVERYPFLKAVLFFFPKGNKELGLSQLRDCSENAKFAKTEAKVVLCFIHLSYEKNYIEAEYYALKLLELYPQNPVFKKFLGRCFVGLGKWPESIALWNDIISRADSSFFGYNNKQLKRESLYYLALSQMRSGNLEDAARNYEASLVICREVDGDTQSPYQVFSTLGLGMINDLRGNRKEALRYYDMVLEMRDIEFSHETAEKFRENPYK